VYEPAGNIDSWACYGDEPVIVQITMSGSVAYLDENAKPKSVTDTDTLRQRYRQWCEQENHPILAIGA